MDNNNKRAYKYVDGAYSKLSSFSQISTNNKANISNITDDINISRNLYFDNSFLSNDLNQKSKKINLKEKEKYFRDNDNIFFPETRSKNIPISIPRDLINQKFNTKNFDYICPVPNLNNYSSTLKKDDKPNQISNNLPIHVTSISITSKNTRSQVYSCDFNSYIIGQKKLKRSKRSENTTQYHYERRINTSSYTQEESAYRDKKTLSVDNSNTENTSKGSINCGEEPNIIIGEKLRKAPNKFKSSSNSYYQSSKIKRYMYSEDSPDENDGQINLTHNIDNSPNKKIQNNKMGSFKGSGFKLKREAQLFGDNYNDSDKINKKMKNNENNLINSSDNNQNISEMSFNILEKTQKSPKQRNSFTSMNFNNLKIEQLYISTDGSVNNNNSNSNPNNYNLNNLNKEKNKPMTEIENFNISKEEENVDQRDLDSIKQRKLDFEEKENYNNFKIIFKERNSKMHLVVLNRLLNLTNDFSKRIKNNFNKKMEIDFEEANENHFKKFTDEKFPPTYKSFFCMDFHTNKILIKNQTFIRQASIEDPQEEEETRRKLVIMNSDKFRNIVFKRPNQVIENYNYSLFSYEIAESLKRLNNEEFINTSFYNVVLSLVKFPNFLYRIFKTNFINYNGYYEVALFINNKWQIVYIDDNLPFDNKKNKFFGASISTNDSIPSELWLLLLQKAISKISGGYLNFIFLDADVLFNLITGFNSLKFDLNNFDLFDYIMDCLKNNFCLCVKSLENILNENFYLNISDAFHILEEESSLNSEDILNGGIEYKIIKLQKPTKNFTLPSEITDFDFIYSKNKLISKEVTSLKLNDKYGYIYLFYKDFKEFFENLYCCLTLVNDENLKISKQKKSILFLKNSSNNKNIQNNEDMAASKVKHYFDNSCFIRTDNDKNNEKDNSNSKIKKLKEIEKEKNKDEEKKEENTKEKIISKKIKRSGSSEFRVENKEDEVKVEKNPIDLKKEKELFKAKFEKAFGKGKPNETSLNNTTSQDIKISEKPIKNENIYLDENPQVTTPSFEKKEKKSTLRRLKEFELDNTELKKVEKTKKVKEENEKNNCDKKLTNDEIFANLKKENKKDELIFGNKPSDSTSDLVKKLKEPLNLKKPKEKASSSENKNKKEDLVSSLRDIVSKNKKLKEEEEMKKKLDQEREKELAPIENKSNSPTENKSNSPTENKSNSPTENKSTPLNENKEKCLDSKEFLLEIEATKSEINYPSSEKSLNLNESFTEKEETAITKKSDNNAIKENPKIIEHTKEREQINLDDFYLKFCEINKDCKNSNKFWKNIQPKIFKGEKFTDENFLPLTNNSFLNMDIHTHIIKEKTVTPSLFNNKLGGIVSSSDNFDNTRIRSRLISQIKPEEIEFKRAEENLTKPIIIQNNFENLEYKRSIYEQCLHCIFSCLSLKPEKIKKLIRINNINEYSYYEVCLFVEDSWQIFFIDDYFLYSKKENSFISYKNAHNQIWPLLIEKAFAKYCGGYYEMYYTDCSKYLRALTGKESGLIKIIKPEIFYFIKENLEKRSILITNTRDFEKISNWNETDLQLKANYFFIIFDAFEFQLPENPEKIKILKIGSYWENLERKGKWSHSSDVLSEEIKQILFKDNSNQNYGYIYVTIDEFIKNFETVFFSFTDDEQNEPLIQIDHKLKELNYFKSEEINSSFDESSLEINSPNKNVEIFEIENIKNTIYLEHNLNNTTRISFSLNIKKYWNDQIYKDEMNQKFTDENFLPNKENIFSFEKLTNDLIYENSINEYSDVIKNKKYENLTWERISELDEFKNKEDLCLIENLNSSSKWIDIYQQDKTDSYFMTIIISLIKKPFLVEKLIRTKRINKFCYYEVVLFIDNDWKVIVIDDYILYDKKKKMTFGVKAYKNQIWPLLLFKAYIKVCKGYLNMSITNPTACLIALTGYESGYYESNKIDIFQFTYESLKNGYFLMARSKKNSESKGAKGNFYYTIVNCFETNKDGNLTKLIKIRAPWPEFNWKGKWDLCSSIWEEETKQIMLKKSLYSLNGFYIVNYEEFEEYFDNLFYCYLNINNKEDNKIPNFQKEFWINDDPFGKINEIKNNKKAIERKVLRRFSSIKKEGLNLSKIKIKPSKEYSTSKCITPINGFNKFDHSEKELNFDNFNSCYSWNNNSRSTSNILDIFISNSNKRKQENTRPLNFSRKDLEESKMKLFDELLSIIEDYRKPNSTNINKTHMSPKKILNEKPTKNEINLKKFLIEYREMASLIFDLTPGSPFESKWYFKEIKDNGVWLSQYEYGNYHFAFNAVNNEIRMGIYKANLQWGKTYVFEFFDNDENSNIFFSFEGIIIDSEKQGNCKFYKKVRQNSLREEVVDLNFIEENLDTNEEKLGKFLMTDGSTWTGPFKENKIKNGSGILRLSDGKTWKCTYKDDKLIQ